jgi:hypothetical protein
LEATPEPAELRVAIPAPTRPAYTSPGNFVGIRNRPIEARTCQQLHPATVEAGVHTASVELDLMRPLRPPGRRIDQFAERRPNPPRKATQSVSVCWMMVACLIGDVIALSSFLLRKLSERWPSSADS